MSSSELPPSLADSTQTLTSDGQVMLTSSPTGWLERLLPVVTLTALWFVPAVLCLMRPPVDDPDVGWHLRTGEWIIQHGAWPSNDEFSATAIHPYVAYSWLFDVTLWGAYQFLGLRGLVLFPALMTTAIQFVLFRILVRQQRDLLVSGGLALMATLAMNTLFTPRPWLISILLWLLEVDVLVTAARTGDHRRLLWLLPLFGVWANVHLHFVGGLVLLALAVIEPWLGRLDRWGIATAESHALAPTKLVAVGALSIVATLINPYHYHLYEVAWRVLGETRLRNLIQEALAIQFRSPYDWLIFAFAVGPPLVIGWRRQVRLWLLLAWVLSVYAGFRCQRELWMIVISGALILGQFPWRQGATFTLAPRTARESLGGLVALMIGGCLALSPTALEARLAKTQPVGAVQFVRAHGFTGPLFNNFDWGGYLIYHLPELPVSIDGRTPVHGEEQVLRNARTYRGERGWSEDPDLMRAALVIAPQQGPLASLLELDPTYCEVYRDSVAAVFQRRINRSPRRR